MPARSLAGAGVRQQKADEFSQRQLGPRHRQPSSAVHGPNDVYPSIPAIRVPRTRLSRSRSGLLEPAIRRKTRDLRPSSQSAAMRCGPDWRLPNARMRFSHLSPPLLASLRVSASAGRGQLTDIVPNGTYKVATDARPAEASERSAPRSRRDQDPALRLRMRRQAQLMVAVAFMMLIATLSVPFVLHYLDIKIP